LVPGLTKADLEDRSFYDLLGERYGIVIASGTQSIEPTVTNEEESDVLGVPLHTPAFLFERTTVSESGRIVEFVRSIYRGDRYRLVADLTPQRSRNGRLAGASRGTDRSGEGEGRRQQPRRASAAFKG
jgi:GntR family transcriptional regulator